MIEILVVIFTLLISVLSLFVCGLLIWDVYFSKKICGKQYIEEYMAEKYGSDWLEQCLNSLRNPSIRQELRNHLLKQ